MFFEIAVAGQTEYERRMLASGPSMVVLVFF
jgi:hypothetical protein